MAEKNEKGCNTFDAGSGSLLVSVEGNIGSGKSTFLSYCSGDPTFEVLHEPIDKWVNVGGVNLLGEFYANPSRWGFAFQMEVLVTMYERYLQRSDQAIKLIERSLWSSRYCFQRGMFECGILDPAANRILDQFHDTVGAHWRARPHAIVYLSTSPVVSHQRLKLRGRSEEANVTLSYLQDLDRYHQDWLSSVRQRNEDDEDDVPLFVINADQPMHEVVAEYQECISNLKLLLL